MLAIAPSMGMTEAGIDAGLARSRGQDELTGADYVESFHALHTPVIDYFERRAKGRWLHWSRPAAWESLELWRDEE